jgi:hypothetical protein
MLHHILATLRELKVIWIGSYAYYILNSNNQFVPDPERINTNNGGRAPQIPNAN